MSIQTELTRLTNAKAAIQTAIEGKGVTVPSGTLLDGMAALIESIEAGGGEYIVEEGQFVPTENVKDQVSIEHSLGVAPFFYVIFLSESSSMNTTVSYSTVMLKCNYIGGSSYVVAKHQSSGSYSATFQHYPVTSYTAATEKYIYADGGTIGGATFWYIAGKIYKWIAIGRSS